MARMAVTIDDQLYEIELDLLKRDGAAILARVNGETVRIILPELEAKNQGAEWVVIDERPYEIAVDSNLHWIRDEKGAHQVALRDLDVNGRRPNIKDGRVKAPIPGLVTSVLVTAGQQVNTGDTLLILEAMKMENEIRAPRSGQVAAIYAVPMANVGRNDILIEIT